jgi:hypothetical protein
METTVCAYFKSLVESPETHDPRDLRADFQTWSVMRDGHVDPDALKFVVRISQIIAGDR